jgi:O-antigen/teichoic acid export membrane protein
LTPSVEPGPGRGGARLSIDRAGAGLGLAAVVDGLLALAYTVVLARLLGSDGYGSLAALVSLFLVGSIAGSALQVSVARTVSANVGGESADLAASVRSWGVRLGAAALVALAVSLALRHPLAAVAGVEEEWAAAFLVPAVVLDLLVAMCRGALLGLRRYLPVALSVAAIPALWLLFGGGLAFAGLDVAGAVAGMALAELVTAATLLAVARRSLRVEESLARAAPRRVSAVAREAAVPIAALGLFAALQNLDVVVVKHAAESEASASSYAAAAVAAKAILWVAVGVGLWLVPEAARSQAAGSDGRPLLWQALGMVGAAAAAAVLLYGLAGEPLLRAVFGPDLALAAGTLPALTAAMGLLACAYLAIQLLLACGRRRFLAPLALAAVVQVPLVALAAPDLDAVALALAALGVVLAAVLVAHAQRAARPVPSGVGHAT